MAGRKAERSGNASPRPAAQRAARASKRPGAKSAATAALATAALATAAFARSAAASSTPAAATSPTAAATRAPRAPAVGARAAPSAPAAAASLGAATTRAPRAPAAGTRAAVPAGDGTRRIVESVTTAIIERRLMPGTKLAEQSIADLFGVSRTLVRQALNQLSRDRLVRLTPARGAFVAEPSPQEAQEVFAVRRMLEAEMTRRLCATITDAQVATLRAHLAAEAGAVARTDVGGRTRLLADFHVLLARMQGNQVLAELLADLLTRSALIALMYQSSHSAAQSQAEHVAIVDALERRDAVAAVRLLNAHLGNVECNLQVGPRSAALALALRPSRVGDR